MYCIEYPNTWNKYFANLFHFDVPSFSSAPHRGLTSEESIELILEFVAPVLHPTTRISNSSVRPSVTQNVSQKSRVAAQDQAAIKREKMSG